MANWSAHYQAYLKGCQCSPCERVRRLRLPSQEECVALDLAKDVAFKKECECYGITFEQWNERGGLTRQAIVQLRQLALDFAKNMEREGFPYAQIMSRLESEPFPAIATT